MAIISGHFGTVVITATTIANTVDNSHWDVAGTSINANVTTSATTGTQYLPIIQDPSWEFSAPYESTETYPVIGDTFTKIWFQYGGSANGRRVQLTTVEDVHLTDDQTDALRIVVRGRGGFATDGVTN